MSDYDITKTRAPIDRFRIVQIVVAFLSIAFLRVVLLLAVFIQSLQLDIPWFMAFFL